MISTRCLGLVGGLGVGATVHYYQSLAKACEAAGQALDIVIANAETSRVFERVQANDRNGLSDYLHGYIQRLQSAGAEIAAIPAVTPHFAIHELAESSPIPVLNIFEPLNRELQARAARRVAVLGTRFVMESALFGEVKGVDFVRAQPQEEDFIHKTYVEVAQAAKASDAQRKDMLALAHTIVIRDCVDAIILAGTDLALVFNSSNTDFPCIDCGDLHLEAILRVLIGGERLSGR